ncbi:MAG: hypothetical protein J6C33_02210 [Lachnospiraceae bacterium]|nr:hypothetical protein [Lachnospiraceae bacterium]
MTPLAAVDIIVNNRNYDYTEKDTFNALYQELAKGIQNKNPTTYISIDSGTKILYQHTSLSFNAIPLIML